jgi:UDP-glucose 4-epimerase
MAVAVPRYPRAVFDVNVRGTFNVLEACVQPRVKRLIYSSSASVYGDAVEEPMTEDHPFNNTNFYGATKIAGEAMARAFHHRSASTLSGCVTGTCTGRARITAALISQ